MEAARQVAACCRHFYRLREMEYDRRHSIRLQWGLLRVAMTYLHALLVTLTAEPQGWNCRGQHQRAISYVRSTIKPEGRIAGNHTAGSWQVSLHVCYASADPYCSI